MIADHLVVSFLPATARLRRPLHCRILLIKVIQFVLRVGGVLTVMIGKKQLNQLITFLDKGANAKEPRTNDALRTVRAKREADEAGQSSRAVFLCLLLRPSTDKEYRKAVHWLETLRLRRVKILESGYKVCPDRSCTCLRTHVVTELAGFCARVIRGHEDSLGTLL